jgi:hypothetical protein
VPGWPDWACSTASIDRARIALMLRQASSSDGGAEACEWMGPSGRVTRARVLSAVNRSPFERGTRVARNEQRRGEGKIIVQGTEARSLYLDPVGPYLLG